MNESIIIILSLVLGVLFGLFYFAGLWLTLKHMPNSKQPVLLGIGSFLGRSAVCLFGFYLISGSGWEAIASSLAGFIFSKVALIIRLKSGSRAEA